MLVGRSQERQTIAALAAGARVGHSGVLVVLGEAGSGKSTLLAEIADSLHDMQVCRVVGSEAERDLGFGGLSQLIGTGTDLTCLPSPQARAMEVALNLRSGAQTDRLAVGAGTLGVLSQRAESRPLAVLIDDAHLVDHSSAQAITFAARRLLADPILLVATLRSGEDSPLLHAGLPRTELAGLSPEDAGRLLATRVGHALSGSQVRRLVRATGGNPLALLELATAPERLESLGPHDPIALRAALAHAFLSHTERLSGPARAALLVAACSGGDPLVVQGACAVMGIDVAVLAEAVDEQLISAAPAVEFRHPLVRAAVIGAAAPQELRAVHAALAQVAVDPDQRAWHRAAAALGPDATIAVELAAVADRARARSAHDVAATALERAAWLSESPHLRAGRLVAAAEAAWVAGKRDRALTLLAQLDGPEGSEQTQPTRSHRGRTAPEGSAARSPGALGVTAGAPTAPRAGAGTRRADSLIARAGHLRGTIASRTGSIAEATEVFRTTATAVQHSLPDAAVELWADGINAAFFRCDTAYLDQAATALQVLSPRSTTPRSRVLGDLARGMAPTLVGRPGADLIRGAVEHLAGSDTLRGDPQRAEWLVLGPLYLREEGRYRQLVQEALSRTREDGALGELARLLFLAALEDAATDHWARGHSEYHESIQLAQAAGQSNDLALALAGLAWLEARMGRERECRAHAAEAVARCRAKDIVIGRIWCGLALGELELGSGHPDRAVHQFDAVTELLRTFGLHDMDLTPVEERAEALLRLGRVDGVLEAVQEFHQLCRTKGHSWALARAERTLGMLSDGEATDRHFATALKLHAQTPDTFETARTLLAQGSSLRRRRRRREAREPLRAAVATFEGLGAQLRAEQAAHELAATGEAVQRRGASRLTVLTAQERQIAELLCNGATTRQAAAALFLSPKTVEYHLRHVYTKLGVRSRVELSEALSRG